MSDTRELQALRQWYPGVPMWCGQATGRWWAMVRGRLLEGCDVRDLSVQLAEVLAHHGGPSTRQTGGTDPGARSPWRRADGTLA